MTRWNCKDTSNVQVIPTCCLCFLNSSLLCHQLLLHSTGSALKYRRWEKFLFPRESTVTSGTTQPSLTGVSCGSRGHKKDPIPVGLLAKSTLHQVWMEGPSFPLLCRWFCSCFSSSISKRCWTTTNIQLPSWVNFNVSLFFFLTKMWV